MKEPECAFLIGPKIYLRPVDPVDVHFLWLGENDPVIRDSLFLAQPVSQSLEEEKVKKYSEAKDSIVLTMLEKKSHRPVGQTAFFRIDYVSRAAVFYLAILSRDHWSKGYGSEATQLMLNYAFLTLNLHRIQLHVCAENAPAIRIYERQGFIREGVLREAMFRNGQYSDFWVMGVLKNEWLKKQRKSESHLVESK